MNKKGIFEESLAVLTTLLVGVLIYAVFNSGAESLNSEVGVAGLNIINSETDYQVELFKLEQEIKKDSNIAIETLLLNGGLFDNSLQNQDYNDETITLWGKGCGSGVKYLVPSNESMEEEFLSVLNNNLKDEYPNSILEINKGIIFDVGEKYSKEYSGRDEGDKEFSFTYENDYKVKVDFPEDIFQDSWEFLREVRDCGNSDSCLTGLAKQSGNNLFYFEREIDGYTLKGLVDFNPSEGIFNCNN